MMQGWRAGVALQGRRLGVREMLQWPLAALTVAGATCWPVDWGFPAGIPVWWLQLLGMAWACSLFLRSATPRAALGGVWVFCTVWLASTTWWLYVAMHTYGGLPGPLAVAAVLLLAAALSSYYALALYVVRRGVAGSGWWPLQFAVCWMMAELARTHWLTGFGWGALGYGHTEGPLATLAPWIGVQGVGAMAVWIAASCAWAFHGRRWAALLGVLAAVGALWLLPRVDFTQTTGTIPVALLQGNIPQDEKFESGSGVPLALKWYAEQLQAEHQALVVAPETAIPLLPSDLPEGYWSNLQQWFASGTGAALIGIPLGDAQSGYSNSAIGLGSGAVYRYDKHHLVPFGEFIPPWFKWFTQMMHIPLGDFQRGGLGQASFQWRGQRLAPNICYEDLFGDELGQRFLEEDSAPTVFVNISNLGWFGDSVVIDQHLQISRMRALEFQRPFLRATNTGATQILDYQGQTQAKLDRFTRGVLHGTVQGRSGTTPFAWWVARAGVWPYWLFAAVVLWLAGRVDGFGRRAARASHAGS